MSESIVSEIAKESARQEESCLWTSTCLYVLSKRNNRYANVLSSIQIILGSAITIKQIAVLQNNEGYLKYIFIISSILITCSPLLNKHFGFSDKATNYRLMAGRYKVLQDKLRRIRTIDCLDVTSNFKDKFQLVIDDLDNLKLETPETSSALKDAKKVINSGIYDFTVDLKRP